MTQDDAHTSHNHGFELPDAPLVVVRNETRPWRAVAGVALCLGLAGIVTGLVVAHRQRSSDAKITADALQREELRDGWKALGAAAAQDARANGVQPSPAANSAAAQPSVVIVNVPAPSAAAPANVAPSNVTNITVPNGAATGSNGAPGSSNASNGSTPIQSMPPINYSPMSGYLPTQGGFTSTPSNGSPQPGYIPPVIYPTPGGYGTPPTGAPTYTPPVGNGSIPGSTPNPALPNNNGLVGSTPTPGQPNGPVNGGAVPTSPVVPSPGTPSLPSGFSAP